MRWGLLLLMLGAALAWLSLGDRMSPLAMYVVELDGVVGIPLFGPALVLGAALTLRALFADAGSSAVSARHQPRLQRPPSGATRGAPATRDAPSGNDWRDLVFAQARSLPLESGCRLQLGRPGAPVALLIERCTVEQARRSARTLARFLSTAPVPPRVRVTIRDCPPPATPWGHLIEGIFREFFPRGAFRSVGQGDSVELLFSDPDPRWR